MVYEKGAISLNSIGKPLATKKFVSVKKEMEEDNLSKEETMDEVRKSVQEVDVQPEGLLHEE